MDNTPSPRARKVYDNGEHCGCTVDGQIASVTDLQELCPYPIPAEWVKTREEFLALDTGAEEEDITGANFFYDYEAEVSWVGYDTDLEKWAAANALIACVKDKKSSVVYATMDNNVD